MQAILDYYLNLGPQFIVSAIVIFLILNLFIGAAAYLILLERKVSAWVQDRSGPNRVGPVGLFQPIADGIKLLLKEDWVPRFVDKALFLLAPLLAAGIAMLGWAVIPWGGSIVLGPDNLGAWLGLEEPVAVQVAGLPVNIGVLYILAIGSLAVYGVVLGGYASNNKFAFFGSVRAAAQMLSYEIPMGLIVLIIVLMAGSLRPDHIVHLQTLSVWNWNVFWQPLLCIVFFVTILAESNRAPFDLAEAEQELVGGFHTEYSSMKWALFFLGEYIHMITASAFWVLLFFGGWDIPFIKEPLYPESWGWVVLKALVFLFKVFLALFLFMWVRWTLPRFRFDQLMRLAWRALIPLSLALLLITGLLKFALDAGPGELTWELLVANIVVAILGPVVWQFLPPPPRNRRVALAGSRFSPAATAKPAHASQPVPA